MSANETTMAGPPPDPGSGPGGVNSNGWLGGASMFDRRDDRKVGRAFGVSMLIHSGLLLLLIIGLGTPAAQVIADQIPLEYKVVFLPEKGPGGGGGGSPAPAPPKPIEIAKHTPPPPPVPTPVATPKPVEPPPVPTLVAPIETNAANIMQSSGTSSVSLAPYGGGGRGGGIGAGTGNGVGVGTGGGFGGGAYRQGAGIEDPVPYVRTQPKYTSDAMRAKIQGIVQLEVVVLENGTVGDVRITRSLDRNFGLDQEAIVAAKQWKFRPATRQGKPVPIIVLLELEFRLH